MGSYITKGEYYTKLEQIRRNNRNIAEAYDHFDYMGEITADEVNRFLEEMTLTPEEFIYFIALWRKHADGEMAGNSMEAALEFIVEDYRNTPWKFVEEFLQNADDCTYDQKPEIEIRVDAAKKAIEFIYNEKGFSAKDIWALTQFRKSNKLREDKTEYLLDRNAEGLFFNEKTGRKGIGFKSVFALPAENVIVHIRSNGYAFMLDKKLNAIVPIWEDGFVDDGKTHVTVELEKPQFSFCLEDIYPHMRELFCVDKVGRIFMDSPILFMHRLKEVRVENILGSRKDYFEIGINEKASSMQYGVAMPDSRKVLSAVCHNGRVCASQWGETEIYLSDNTGNRISIPAVRYAETRLIDGYYRLFSVVAPIMKSDKQEWEGGSLFRTFPVIDHQYSIPFAMDIPFELNSARKGVDFTNDRKRFNTEIYEAAFDTNTGTLKFFLEKFRGIPNIAIDRYFSETGAVLFESPENRYNNAPVLPIFDLECYMESAPVFPMFLDDDNYISYQDLICVDPDLLGWPNNNLLMSLLLGDKQKCLVAEQYMRSDFLARKRNSVFNTGFIGAVNSYLDRLELIYGVDSREFELFLSKNLYPYLCEYKEVASKIGAFKKLRLLVFAKYQNGQKSYSREQYDEGTCWLEGTRRDSLNEYRTIASLLTAPNQIIDVFRTEFGIHSVDTEFSFPQIRQHCDACTSWQQLCRYLEGVFYYGYSINQIVIPILDNMAISEEIDLEYNPFRDIGVVTVISAADVRKLADLSGINLNQMTERLKAAGLRKGTDFFNQSGSYLVLNPISIQLLQRLKGEALSKCLNRMADIINENRCKLDLSYDSIRNGEEDLTIFFLMNKDLIAQESYLALCEESLKNESLWRKGNNESAEILLRSVNGARTQDITSQSVLKIDLEYLLKHKLNMLYMNAVEKRGFAKYISITNRGCFEELSAESVLNDIGVYAPDKLEEQRGKRFFAGNLLAFGERKQFYLIDNTSQAIFLHKESNDDYIESLHKYLRSPYDEEKVRYSSEFRKQTRKVYEEIIAPVISGTDHDLDRAFDEIEGNFRHYSKKEIINIIAWFRYNSYAKALGGASLSHEQEIEDDYKADPCRFVYEFLQNVDDCTFAKAISPELFISINAQSNSICFEYNENGFEIDDIKALTAFGNSVKGDSLEKQYVESGVFDLEKTGRKGRGFKSVFALPGKDIVVHICSNGFSFKFVKRFGEIIPIWEDIKNAPSIGTRIIVEGFQGNSISTIYSALLAKLCAGERADFFAKSPILYMRKLKKVSVTNGTQRYELGMKEKDRQFSTDVFTKGNLRVVSGIVDNGVYKKSLVSQFSIDVSMSGQQNLHINAVKLCKMEEIYGETRLISVVAPVIKEKDKQIFERGALYCTLPLDENTFRIPLAINASFTVNSGRSSVVDEVERRNKRIYSLLLGEVFRDFYRLIRDIPDISIENYIYEKNADDGKLFTGMLYVDTVDLVRVTRNIPVLKLYSGKGFASCNEAKLLPHECYKWQQPDSLAKIFNDTTEDKLVDEKYTSKRIGANRINLITVNFHGHINQYVDFCRENADGQIWNLLEESILPYIGKHYDQLASVYRTDAKEQLLKTMNVFPYTTYRNEKCLGNLAEQVIWLKDCPTRFKSFGTYRSLSTAPIHYTDSILSWMDGLADVQDYREAFTEDKLKLDSVSSWEELKKWLEIFIYYNISPSFKIAFLAKCAISKALSPIKNFFRDAFLESGDKEILVFCIDEKEIDAIVSDIEGYGYTSRESIIRMLRDLGLKPEDDYFEIERGLARLKKETISMMKNYGKNQETSQECVQNIKDAYKKLRSVHGIQLPYEDIKLFQPVLITEILKQKLLKTAYLSKLAGEVFKYYSVKCQNTDYAEMMLVALSLMSEESDREIELDISLSDILERRIATNVKNGMSSGNGKNLILTIERDIETEPYESKEVKKSLSWLQDSDQQNISDIESFEYYTGDIQNGFAEDDKGFFLFDSNSVVLDCEQTSSNLLEFVRARYSANADGELFSGLIKIVSIQNELTGGWKKSKREYIERLAEFREETQKYINFLCPGYQRNINQATGKAEEYLIPELLQNINDCRGKNQSTGRILNISMENRKMVLQYNEAGFEFSDVYSITAYGQSTKHDEREGEKGLGFKKVFSVFPTVEIYSNGFAFSLTKEKATVPKWIESEEDQRTYMRPGYTTMVFKIGTLQFSSLSKIEQIWKKSIKNPDQAGLFLALQNIDYYQLKTQEKEYRLNRKDMLKHYYNAEVPLIKLYKMLLMSNRQPAAVVNDYMHALKGELKKRKKCAVMNDIEFDKYVDNLPVSLYIPKTEQRNKGGLLYSTLPTAQKLGAEFFINMPLELSTGRNEILDDSAFNQAVWNIVFERSGTQYSSFNYILCNLMANCKDLDIYTYFNGSIDPYVEMISKGDQEKAVEMRKELDCIPIFRAYPDGRPVPLCKAYTAEPIVYEYLYSSVEKRMPFDKWLEERYPEISAKALLALKDNDLQHIDTINRLANSIGENQEHFPMKTENPYMAISYFEKEYEKLGGSNE